MSIVKVIFYLRTWTFSRTFQIYWQICVEFSLRNQQKIVLVYDLRKFGLEKVVLVLMVVKKLIQKHIISLTQIYFLKNRYMFPIE